MFLYRVKIEERDATRLVLLRKDIADSEALLRAQCPILEMSLVTEADKELDVYLALEDVIDSTQLRNLVGELNTLLEGGHARVSSELIHI